MQGKLALGLRSQCDKTGIVGPGADLRGADLRGVYLYAVDLSGADLSGADLASAQLIRVRLHGADLTDAIFRDTDMMETLYDEQTRWPSDMEPPPAA